MDAIRVDAIRARNVAFDRLQRAVIRCELERHKVGSIPPIWADRLAELERQYRAALADCARATGGR